MKTLVIYDNTGEIYLMLYGTEKVPQGLKSIFVDIPEGSQLERIDITDPSNPKPVFSYLPDTDIGRLQKEVATITSELTDAKRTLAEQCEINLALQSEVINAQLALVELYERTRNQI